MRRAFSQKFGRSGSRTEQGKTSQEKESVLRINKAGKKISFREPEVDNRTKPAHDGTRDSNTVVGCASATKRCAPQRDLARTWGLQGRSISLEDVDLQVRGAMAVA